MTTTPESAACRVSSQHSVSYPKRRYAGRHSLGLTGPVPDPSVASLPIPANMQDRSPRPSLHARSVPRPGLARTVRPRIHHASGNESPMRRTFPFFLLTACGLIAASAGCRSKDSGTETASRQASDSVDAAAERDDEVAITTGSDEARTLYLRGRALSEQLRTHDARKLFEQAAAKDPTFALVHYDLAIISPTPKEFLEHLNKAVTLSGKASEGERLMILALQAGSNGDSKKSLEHTEELAAKYPRDARAQTLLGFAYSTQQEFDKAVSTADEGDGARPELLAGLQPAGLRVHAAGEVRRGGDGVQEVHRARPQRPEPLRLVRRDVDEDGAVRRIDRPVQEGAVDRPGLQRLASSASPATSCTRASTTRRRRRRRSSTTRPATTATGAPRC